MGNAHTKLQEKILEYTFLTFIQKILPFLGTHACRFGIFCSRREGRQDSAEEGQWRHLRVQVVWKETLDGDQERHRPRGGRVRGHGRRAGVLLRVNRRRAPTRVRPQDSASQGRIIQPHLQLNSESFWFHRSVASAVSQKIVHTRIMINKGIQFSQFQYSKFKGILAFMSTCYP